MTVANFTSSSAGPRDDDDDDRNGWRRYGANSICNRRRRASPIYDGERARGTQRTPVVRGGDRARNFKEKHFHCHTPGRSVARRFYATRRRQMLGVVTTDGRHTLVLLGTQLHQPFEAMTHAGSFHPRARASKAIEARTGSSKDSGRYFVRS